MDKPRVENKPQQGKKPDPPVKVLDRYGFYVPIGSHELESELGSMKRLNARVEKWRKWLPSLESLVASNSVKLKQRTRKGIPDGVRLNVWPFLARTKQTKTRYKSITPYSELIKETEFAYEAIIDADVTRTFPNHQLFAHHNEIGLASLKNVLKAVSLTHSDMGYCQGLNFIVAAFIIYMNDEEAYYLTISLLDNYACEEMYQDVGSVRKYLYVHDALVKKFMPDVSAVLEEYGLDSIMFATSWYMTLFSSNLPFTYFLHTMDIFFLEGWKIIYRVAMAILKVKRAKILASKSFEEVYKHLKDFSDLENTAAAEDAFFAIACKSFIFSKKLILKYEAEYYEKNPKKPPQPNTKSTNQKQQTQTPTQTNGAGAQETTANKSNNNINNTTKEIIQNERNGDHKEQVRVEEINQNGDHELEIQKEGNNKNNQSSIDGEDQEFKDGRDIEEPKILMNFESSSSEIDPPSNKKIEESQNGYRQSDHFNHNKQSEQFKDQEDVARNEKQRHDIHENRNQEGDGNPPSEQRATKRLIGVEDSDDEHESMYNLVPDQGDEQKNVVLLTYTRHMKFHFQNVM